MSDAKYLIEVLAGLDAGRKWERFSTVNDCWLLPPDQSRNNLLATVLMEETYRLAPLPDEITIPARVIPTPLLVAENGQIVYKADPSQWTQDDGFSYVESVRAYREWLAKGLLHATSGNAIAASKAMCPYA